MTTQPTQPTAKKASYTEMQLLLVLLVTFNIGLSLARIGYSQRLTFVFLIWNLFLALLPYGIARIVRRLQEEGHTRWVIGLYGLISVLFLPNAPYLLTDLFHLSWAGNSAPLWLDTLLLLSYIGTGMVLFYRTLFILLQVLARYARPVWVQGSAVVLIYLTSFGMYLGRYLRFNSWDLLADPMTLVWVIFERLAAPAAHPRTWGVTLGYGTLLLLGYIGVKLWERYWQRNYGTITSSSIWTPPTALFDPTTGGV